MFTDGLTHNLDYYVDQFAQVEVTPQNFEHEKGHGLYSYSGDLEINENTESLEFFYFNDDGKAETWDHETVPVVRDGQRGPQGLQGVPGVKGEDGERAPSYKGAFTEVPSGSFINKDTYLNTSTKKVYRYNGSSWSEISSDDPDWWAAMGDAINYSASSGVHVDAAEIWVAKIVAGTMLADAIMAKTLTIQNHIKSLNYDGVFNEDGTIKEYGTQGFAFDKKGQIDLINIHSKGGEFSDFSVKNGFIYNNRIIHFNFYESLDEKLKDYLEYAYNKDGSVRSVIQMSCCGYFYYKKGTKPLKCFPNFMELHFDNTQNPSYIIFRGAGYYQDGENSFPLSQLYLDIKRRRIQLSYQKNSTNRDADDFYRFYDDDDDMSNNGIELYF